MIHSIYVYSRYIKVNYFNPKPKGRWHSFKVEIADDKFDMSDRHRKTLLELVADHCISDIDIESYYIKADYDNLDYDNRNYIIIDRKIAEKYKNSYKTPVC